MPWYLGVRMQHTVWSAAATLIFILLQLARAPTSSGAAMPSVPEMTTLAVVLALFGVPHGATDHLVAASIFRRSFPRIWLLVFVVMYLSMMAAVVLSWKVAPVFSLVSFLLMSVVHWGLGDAEEDLVPTKLLAVEVCVRGCVPILLPCVAFKGHVLSIFSWLVGPVSVVR
jgi:Brp/Blh family beta-carotene 15,15'-monooxygenase